MRRATTQEGFMRFKQRKALEGRRRIQLKVYGSQAGQAGLGLNVAAVQGRDSKAVQGGH